MRILARFPKFDEESPADAASRSPQAAQARAAVVEKTVAEPVVERPVAQDEPAELAEPASTASERQRLADRLKHVVTPRRRGLREIHAGWGSIGFLAVIAAGVWGLAWWRDHQTPPVVDEHAVPHVAAAPLESPSQLTR